MALKANSCIWNRHPIPGEQVRNRNSGFVLAACPISSQRGRRRQHCPANVVYQQVRRCQPWVRRSTFAWGGWNTELERAYGRTSRKGIIQNLRDNSHGRFLKDIVTCLYAVCYDWLAMQGEWLAHRTALPRAKFSISSRKCLHNASVAILELPLLPRVWLLQPRRRLLVTDAFFSSPQGAAII